MVKILSEVLGINLPKSAVPLFGSNQIEISTCSEMKLEIGVRLKSRRRSQNTGMEAFGNHDLGVSVGIQGLRHCVK